MLSRMHEGMQKQEMLETLAKLNNIWRRLGDEKPTLITLQEALDLFLDGTIKKNFIEFFNNAISKHGEHPVMSVCIFLLFESINKGPDRVSEVLYNMATMLQSFATARKCFVKHAGLERTTFYDHIYGLYVVCMLRDQNVGLADVLKIAQDVPIADAISTVFQEWIQSSNVVANWSASPVFGRVIVHVICTKILPYGVPTANPLVTLMLELEKWGAVEIVKAAFRKYGVSDDVVDRPEGAAPVGILGLEEAEFEAQDMVEEQTSQVD